MSSLICYTIVFRTDLRSDFDQIVCGAAKLAYHNIQTDTVLHTGHCLGAKYDLITPDAHLQISTDSTVN